MIVRNSAAKLRGVPVLGPVDSLADYPQAWLSVCIGRPNAYAARREIVERIKVTPERFATIVHPSAVVGATCVVGQGTVLLAQAVLTADVVVGRHVCVMPQVVLTHDVVVDDYVTIASGVRVGGGAHIAEGAYLGSGSSVREGCHVGSWAMVGMNAAVTRDIPEERLWHGIPARDIRRAPVPWPEIKPSWANMEETP